MKLITFTVPCYNSAAYMEHCIDSLLPAGDDCEIILVDDGSTDDTGAIADRYAAEHPDTIRVIHQENGGHGEGVNQGIRNAQGLYFKVVDSDDSLDRAALENLIVNLRTFSKMEHPIDLVVANYVYEHAADNTEHAMRFVSSLPTDRAFTWSEVGSFKASQFISMHACVYRTQVLRDSGLLLPKHTFYVDNLYVYQPLPYVKSLWYLNIDLYRYFIGRDDQSVTEANMIKRIDQHILVTRLLIDSHDLEAIRKTQKRLAKYMYHYVAIMLMICTIYLWLSGTKENIEKADALWDELKWSHPGLYRRMRRRSCNALLFFNPIGRRFDLFVYRLLRKHYKFN